MKINKLWRQFIYLAVFAFLLASCNFWPVSETVEVPQTYARSTLGRKDALALWHLAEKHEISEEELRGRVQSMQKFDASVEKRNVSNITGVHNFSITV
jgi:hypothetical protein